MASRKFQGSVMIRVRPSFFIMKTKGKKVTVGIDSFNDGNETKWEAWTKIGGMVS